MMNFETPLNPRYFRSDVDSTPAGELPIESMACARDAEHRDAPFPHCLQVNSERYVFVFLYDRVF